MEVKFNFINTVDDKLTHFVIYAIVPLNINKRCENIHNYQLLAVVLLGD